MLTGRIANLGRRNGSSPGMQYARHILVQLRVCIRRVEEGKGLYSRQVSIYVNIIAVNTGNVTFSGFSL